MARRIILLGALILPCISRLVAPAGAEVVLVENGVSRAPIVVFADAPPFTRRAADELAGYIEKVSGARPPVLEGRPDPLPERAIWVGYQPALDELFPEIDFDFRHPEEILIAANGGHLVIAGRDRWHPDHLQVSLGSRPINGVQQEYGTVNAVYTFLQDYLGVRWLWPGELGEDVLKAGTLAFASFEYRYHPQFRGRAGAFYIYILARQHQGHEWTRYQRLQLDSLYVEGGHGFENWWERFHETNPEFFALQPDGTRGGGEKPYPANQKMVKVCKSNPAVWAQWLEDVETALENNPNQQVFYASANDGWMEGYCICENCRAWDPPGGRMVRYAWQGLSQEYVPMSDRQVTLANTLGRLLRARYPDRDYYVCIMAYGNSRPAPVAAVPDDNVIVGGVFSFINNHPSLVDHRQQFLDWAGITRNFAWRPNISSTNSWKNGLPIVTPHRAFADLRLAADNNVMAIFFDSIWGHWANQAPHYYAVAQMTWNPYADGEAILDDFYRRAYGPAAGEMTAYWTLLEQAAEAIVFDRKPEAEAWDADFSRRAYAQLDRATTAAAGASEVYGKRIAFARAGLDYLRLALENQALLARVRESQGRDEAALATARANMAGIWRLIGEHHPFLVNPSYIRPGSNSSYIQGFDPDQLP